MYRIVIIGGGLGGLTTALHLSSVGITCTVIEKQHYPFHRVCGEYISNEVVPYLTASGLMPEGFQPPKIERFQLSSTNGKSAILNLDLGGFGISRFSFDHFFTKRLNQMALIFFSIQSLRMYHSMKTSLKFKLEAQHWKQILL